ncbi:MAG TPA: extracellular solute-binding protein [Tepidisphaeraceae bacterium]|jgi:raffinose/stachyose/melibiose transport system substrate-binding protein|nr:extracellular solute-binding protein [Tepidisphaeraceae bacterium]
MADVPRKGFLNSTVVGVTVLSVAMIASLIQVIRGNRELSGSDGRTVLRVCHWQLEDGFRAALQGVIDDYEKLHPDVRIVQMPITEKVYGQWLNTQLISGTAPDLIESGMSKYASNDESMVRYFLALGGELSAPNPYNRGTNLEGVPWRETTLDGMKIGYRPKLLDYYAIPATLAGTRIFVNRTLLEEVTGSKQTPKSLGELMAIGKAVNDYAQRTKQPIRTVASTYSLKFFYGRYNVAFTTSLEPQLDINLDGMISPLETYEGVLKNKVGFDTPSVKAYYEMMEAFAGLLGEGYAAIDRQQAQFNFSQGRAIFLGTGSWDAEGIRNAMDGKGWDLAVIDFPLPAPDERWGQYVSGRAADAGAWGVPFAVFKGSPNQERALDFLRYLTSQRANEKMNKAANWPPVTIGAEPSELMRPFVPDPTGYTSHVQFNIGAQVGNVLSGQETLFYSGETSYESMVKTVNEAIRNPTYGGDRAWSLDHDMLVRESRNQERVLAMQATRKLLDPSAEADATEKLRKALLQQVIKNNGAESAARYEELRGHPIPPI